jgi:hypothetical protein
LIPRIAWYYALPETQCHSLLASYYSYSSMPRHTRRQVTCIHIVEKH